MNFYGICSGFMGGGGGVWKREEGGLQAVAAWYM